MSKRKQVSANTSNIDATLLVEDGMTALQVVSAITAAPPQPKHVETVLSTVAHTIATDLTQEVLAAREGCKRKETTIQTQLENLVQLNRQNEELSRQQVVLERQLAAQRHNARGNVVLVRRDGFSKPMTIAPSRSFGPEPEFPHYIEAYDCPSASPRPTPPGCYPSVTASFETLRFHLTRDKDGFGRVIYVQI